MRAPKTLLAVAITATVLVGSMLHTGVPVAAETEYRRGPDPTAASISAQTGSFATASTTVSASQVSGFGGGRIYYPTDTSQGTFGAIAFAPGNLSTSSLYTWMGPRIASQGFVVFLIDTRTRFDLPPSRGQQLLTALDYLVASSSVRTRVDRTRLAVGGHSFGGGGALEAARSRPSLQAAIPLQPWSANKSWPTIAVPTFIVGAENDTVASPANHAELFYASIPDASEKGYLELNGATHSVGTDNDTTTATYMIVWLKRYVDNDTRYEPFLCPTPGPSATIEEFRGTCPG
jgi:dienelactone hydrolase